MAKHLNDTPRYVATHTRADLVWRGAQTLDGDLTSAVINLKSTGEGDFAVLGSGVLVAHLLVADLVDHVRLFIHPLLLGTGKRLFGSLPAPRHLQLAEINAMSGGSTVSGYDLA